MTVYRIDQAAKRRGHKTWTCPHPSFRYSNMEAADAHATHLRFKDRKSQFVIHKEEDWGGDVRNFFRADDRPLVPGPYLRGVVRTGDPITDFVNREIAPLSITPDGVVSVPRHRRSR